MKLVTSRHLPRSAAPTLCSAMWCCVVFSRRGRFIRKFKPHPLYRYRGYISSVLWVIHPATSVVPSLPPEQFGIAGALRLPPES